VKKCKDQYCAQHRKNYNTCPICMNDAIIEDTLLCGHMMCQGCSYVCAHDGKTECPMCRQKTNIDNYFITKNLRIELSRKMEKMISSVGVKNKIKIADEIMSYVFENHYYFLHTNLREAVRCRLLHFKSRGMNVDIYEKQLASYMNRLEM